MCGHPRLSLPSLTTPGPGRLEPFSFLFFFFRWSSGLLPGANHGARPPLLLAKATGPQRGSLLPSGHPFKVVAGVLVSKRLLPTAQPPISLCPAHFGGDLPPLKLFKIAFYTVSAKRQIH